MGRKSSQMSNASERGPTREMLFHVRTLLSQGSPTGVGSAGTQSDPDEANGKYEIFT